MRFRSAVGTLDLDIPLVSRETGPRMIPPGLFLRNSPSVSIYLPVRSNDSISLVHGPDVLFGVVARCQSQPQIGQDGKKNTLTKLRQWPQQKNFVHLYNSLLSGPLAYCLQAPQSLNLSVLPIADSPQGQTAQCVTLEKCGA